MTKYVPPVQRIETAVEHWRPIPGYEGLYEISDQGRVRGLDRVIQHPVKGPTRRRGQMIAAAHGPWYSMIPLHRDGKQFNGKIHRLVLEAFIGECPEGMIGCHNDGNFRNNCLTNLRWDTPSSNSFDTVRHGRHRARQATHCANGHIYDEMNTCFRPNGRRQCRSCRRDRKRRHYAKSQVAV